MHFGISGRQNALAGKPDRQKGQAHKQPDRKFPRGEIPEINQRRADPDREDAQESVADLARSYGVSPAAIYRATANV
jgi:hypothetical protein